MNEISFVEGKRAIVLCCFELHGWKVTSVIFGQREYMIRIVCLFCVFILHGLMCLHIPYLQSVFRVRIVTFDFHVLFMFASVCPVKF